MTAIPSNFKASLSTISSPFDSENIIDDDKELWLIRVPDNITEEDLANLKFKLPTEKATKKALGKLEKGNTKYALYKVPTADNLKSESDQEDQGEDQVDIGVSGHEMVSFDCLVPSERNEGRLVYAPKKFNQYLILNQVVDIPDTTILAQSILDKPVYKREQPEGLKMRYMPYGYYSGEVTTTMEEAPVKEEKKRKRAVAEEQEKSTEKKKSKKEKKSKK